jgi:hypothetical protein
VKVQNPDHRSQAMVLEIVPQSVLLLQQSVLQASTSNSHILVDLPNIKNKNDMDQKFGT